MANLHTKNNKTEDDLTKVKILNIRISGKNKKSLCKLLSCTSELDDE